MTEEQARIINTGSFDICLNCKELEHAPTGSNFYTCKQCGHVKAVQREDEHSSILRIYSDFDCPLGKSPYNIIYVPTELKFNKES